MPRVGEAQSEENGARHGEAVASGTWQLALGNYA